jgi:hypothetical protein
LVEFVVNVDDCNGVEGFILGKNVFDVGGILCIDELKREPLDGTGGNGDDKVKSAAGLIPPVNDVFKGFV